MKTTRSTGEEFAPQNPEDPSPVRASSLPIPSFQGLAIRLMFGEIASLLIGRMAVPALYYMANQRAAAAGATVSA